MNETLSPGEDALFERIVLGEADPDAPDVRKRIESSQSLRKAVEEWREVCTKLTKARQTDTKEALESTQAVSAEDRELIRELASRHASERASQKRQRRMLWLGLMVLAAVAATTAVVVLASR